MRLSYALLFIAGIVAFLLGLSISAGNELSYLFVGLFIVLVVIAEILRRKNK